MRSPLECESTLTDRYQTTVPETVRRALGLSKRSKIRYSVRASGEVVLERADAAEDYVLGAFLKFLANDLAKHPERLQSVDADFARRLETLTGGVDFDLDAPLNASDD
ncbi:MAG: type II toxin-antitoxin system PrlF family antitoxin [Parvularculaceae bacterium]